MNPAYDSGNYYLNLHKNQSNDGGVLLYSKPTSGSAQLDWQIVNQGTTGDLKFYAAGLAGNALVLDRETGNLQLPEYGAGTLVSDASGNITVSSGGGAGGPYLPLSAGTSFPLTGGLSFSITTDTVSPVASIKYNSNNYVYFTGGTSGALFGNSNQSVRLQANATSLQMLTSGASRMFIDSSGNVGIGTTSPGDALVVKGGSPGNIDLVSFQNNAGNETHRFYTDSANDGVIETVTNAGVTANLIQSSGNSYFNGGNVGIGVTAPVAKLDVLGTSGGPVVFDYAYATNAGLRIHGDESAMDIVGTDVGNHASTILLRNGNEGFGLLNNPNLNTLQFRSFTATSDAFSIHNTGSNLSSLVDIVTLEKDGNVGIGTTSPSEKLEVNGNIKVDNVLLSNQQNTDVSGLELVANVLVASYTAAFFDFVVKKGTNVRSGTVYACHDGTNVEFTETSTNDLGDTSDVVLSVDISGTNMRLLADAATSGWSVKSLIRAI